MALRVGIVGFGELGKYLLAELSALPDRFEVVFIYNRTPVAHPLYVASVTERRVDLLVEVAHPCVIRDLGLLHLGADLFVGSPTAFASGEELVIPTGVACYVPVGALWGAEDILKLQSNLAGLAVTMAKHPEHLRTCVGELRERLDAYVKDEHATQPLVLYKGPVRELCPLAPNNVNTMACAALVGLGFDRTQGCLVADKNLTGHHVVTVEAVSKGGLEVTTVRRNPAKLGAVTGHATFASFFQSLLRAHSKPKGRVSVV
jgi:aspartate dehydrogenase